jgi:hypothetical protein
LTARTPAPDIPIAARNMLARTTPSGSRRRKSPQHEPVWQPLRYNAKAEGKAYAHIEDAAGGSASSSNNVQSPAQALGYKPPAEFEAQRDLKAHQTSLTLTRLTRESTRPSMR